MIFLRRDKSERRVKEAFPFGEVFTTEPPPPIFGGGGRDLDYYRHIGTTPLEVWYCQLNRFNLTGFSGTVDAAKLYAFPFHVSKGHTIDRIGITVGVAASVASTKARLGIYETISDSNVYPGDLLLDAGEVDVDSTGDKDITIDQAISGPGLYFLAVIFQDATDLQTQVASAVASSQKTGAFKDGSTWRQFEGYMHDQAYGALPDPYPQSSPEGAVPPTLAVSQLPMIRVRLSA